MNKSDLIGLVAKQAGISKAKARDVVRTVEAALAPAPSAPAAIRRRPYAKVALATKTVVKFKPGKAVKDGLA